MDGLNLFLYFPGNSFVHRSDPRLKLLFFAYITFSLFRAWVPANILAALSVLVLIPLSRVPLGKALKSLFPYTFLFIIIMGSRYLTGLHEEAVSENLFEGLLLVSRLLFAILTAHLFTSTTSTEETRKSLYWFLKPVSNKAAFYISSMFSITISFLPLLVKAAGDIRSAQQTRCIDSSKNFLRKIRFFVISLILAAAEMGERIADAMDSRCYNENRSCFFKKPVSRMFLLFLTALLIGTSLL